MRVTVRISTADQRHNDHDHFEVVVDDPAMTCEPDKLGPALELMFGACHWAAYGSRVDDPGEEEDDDGDKWKSAGA